MTDKILDLGDKYNEIFVFFLLPHNAEKHKETIRRMVSAGHIIGSHFLSHKSYLFVDKARFQSELRQSVDELSSVAETKIEYCRAPYGRIFPWQQKWITELGLQHMYWTLDSQDYYQCPAQLITHRLTQKICRNDIVLFHDGDTFHHELDIIVEHCLQSINLSDNRKE
jgi:peptidoglycan/xylan/chitin deacetylase (PgdA/CDA1 family)